MSKKKRKGVASAEKRIVRTPMFRMRVVEDKTKYSRKRSRDNFLKEGFVKLHLCLKQFNKTFFMQGNFLGDLNLRPSS